jgi:hypothetical protein
VGLLLLFVVLLALALTPQPRRAWLWWKFWAWVTKPWVKKEVIDNPRGKKRRGDPAWMLNLVWLMRFVNAWMMAVIVVAFVLLWAVNL